MKERYRRGIIEALVRRFGLSVDEIPGFSVEAPNLEAHGDLATNVAMMLVKQRKRSPKLAEKLSGSPRDIAGDIAADLASLPFIERLEVAGPGFLNAHIRVGAWQALLVDILQAGADFGRSECPDEDPIMVEFVSANPTGPLHVGHGRGAVVGDVLSNLLAFSGRRVLREYYVNDAGRQVRNLARSVVWWLNKDHGQVGELPADGYAGEYVASLARGLPRTLTGFVPGEPAERDLVAIERYAAAAMLADIRRDLEAFGVRMDHFTSERELLESGRLDEAVAELEQRGALEDRDGARWFLSDRFGDEKPRVLIKSDGSETYFATDVAYHLDKLRRGFGTLINVWGADHHGYVPRMRSVLQALGRAPEALHTVLVQMVSLVRDGKPVILSKRAGELITLRQLFEEVGCDAARFFFLMRGPDSQMEFDLELAKRRSLDNPVFYVQYGHARCSSILARAKERGVDVPDPGKASGVDLSGLAMPGELRMIKKMWSLPEVVRRAADNRAPHQLVYFLQELVGEFHSYYTTTGSTQPILRGDPSRIAARLILVQALRQVLRNALGLLGVSAPERMEAVDLENPKNQGGR